MVSFGMMGSVGTLYNVIRASLSEPHTGQMVSRDVYIYVSYVIS